MALNSQNSIPSACAERDDGVRRMSGTLSCDFANGAVGERRDGFQHAALLLRRLAARRDRLSRATTPSGAPA